MARSPQLKRLLKRIDTLKDAPRKPILNAMARGAEKIAATQRYLAPVDTGALRDSIHVTLPGEATPAYSQPGGSQVAGPFEIIITAGDHVTRYSHLVEFGTNKTFPQPYFWPGFRVHKQAVQKSIDRAGRKAIRDIWKGKP